MTLLAPLLFFTQKSPVGAQSVPQRGGSVVVAISGEPAMLNPAVTTSVANPISTYAADR
jgi:hypothetical protein